MKKPGTNCSNFYEKQHSYCLLKLRHLYLVTPEREISSKFVAFSEYVIGKIFPDGAVLFLCYMVSMRYFINFHTSVVFYRICVGNKVWIRFINNFRAKISIEFRCTIQMPIILFE